MQCIKSALLIASKIIQSNYLKYIQSICLDEPCGIFVSILQQQYTEREEIVVVFFWWPFWMSS